MVSPKNILLSFFAPRLVAPRVRVMVRASRVRLAPALAYRARPCEFLDVNLKKGHRDFLSRWPHCL